MTQKYKVLFLMLMSAALVVVHGKLPDLPEQDYFLFADQLITIKAHVYFVEEHLSRACLLLAVSLAITHPDWDNLKRAAKAFAIFECFVLADYLLTYQRGLYFLRGFDSNTVKLVVYGVISLAIVFNDKFKKSYATNS